MFNSQFQWDNLKSHLFQTNNHIGQITIALKLNTDKRLVVTQIIFKQIKNKSCMKNNHLSQQMKR